MTDPTLDALRLALEANRPKDADPSTERYIYDLAYARGYDAAEAVLSAALASPLKVWSADEATAPDSPFEYDQGDIVLVHYDELYDLKHPRSAALASASAPTSHVCQDGKSYPFSLKGCGVCGNGSEDPDDPPRAPEPSRTCETCGHPAHIPGLCEFGLSDGECPCDTPASSESRS